MKKTMSVRIGVLALALCLMTACFLSGTMARYISSVVGTGTVNVAKWDVSFKQGDTTETAAYTFNLKDTKTTNNLVNSSYVAPGDSGSFVVDINSGDTKVAYKYSVALNTENLTTTAGNVKFYSDAAHTTAWADIDGDVALGGTDPAAVTIYWQWEGGEANNANDTTAGIAAADLTFTVTLSAQQTLGSDT